VVVREQRTAAGTKQTGPAADFRQAVKLHRETLALPRRGRGLHRIERELAAAVERAGIQTGLCSVFVAHTSASLVIQENADSAVLRDLERGLQRLVPEDAGWEHDDEGPDDMPAHLRTALTHTSETIPVEGGRLALGTWQGVYLWEHRDHPHGRTVVVTVIGE
jgi:secondary thiamine-phosphate synthase enzyme